MFGVLSAYELQVMHDWIPGEASRDGRAYNDAADDVALARRPAFRVASRLAADRGKSGFEVPSSEGAGEVLDIDLQALKRRFARLGDAGQADLPAFVL